MHWLFIPAAGALNQSIMNVSFVDWGKTQTTYSSHYISALIADSEEHLQRMLDLLSHWCSQNKMSVNISKTKVVHFRKKNKALTDFEFKLGDSKLQICRKYKYLEIGRAHV